MAAKEQHYRHGGFKVVWKGKRTAANELQLHTGKQVTRI
ncbi:MAG: hypothetical protein ACI80L_000835 [Pseudohongiellaceae bacterium]|jgi:hypothetical protein